jgi:hypothetical protein
VVKDYLSNRVNVVQRPAAELNAKLAALALAFDETWLKADHGRPLQVLWRRQDALATNELLNFGDAVERFHQEAPAWLTGQVRVIKTRDAGQSAGAIFEILGLNLFSRQSCRLIPAPDSRPGFDGTLVLNDDSRVLVSLKNHGMSSREREFLAEAKAFDEEFKAQLNAHGLRDCEVMILGANYLDAAAFRSLKTDIANCLTDLKKGKLGGQADRPHTISLKPIVPKQGSLSAFGASSSCRIMSPLAPNEQANFEDAIRKGCENLYRQTGTETGEFCRMIILRLSNTASISKCREWATWYFSEYPADPVDVVMLYQSVVTTNVASDTSSITHSVATVTGPRFQTWQRRKDGSVRRLPNMSFFVGVISNEQPRLLLTSDGVNGIELSNYYMYQRADLYQKVELPGVTTGNLSNPASGVMIHAVFEQNGAPVMTLSPKVERDKVLALLP